MAGKQASNLQQWFQIWREKGKKAKGLKQGRLNVTKQPNCMSVCNPNEQERKELSARGQVSKKAVKLECKLQ